MLDVHAPHSPTHSWKDFLFHIAAIACGPLLALALEKSVEYLHERHLLSDARRELSAELEDNRAVWQKNSTETQRIQRALEADLKVIRALRTRAPNEGKLDYSADLYATVADRPVGRNYYIRIRYEDQRGDRRECAAGTACRTPARRA